MTQIECRDLRGIIHPVDSGDIVDSLHAYGVYTNDGSVLLIQDPHSLRWEFPGGRIESNETVHQGIAREFIEETGLIIGNESKLITEWIEHFFDIGCNQAWRAKRKFCSISNIQGDLLESGNDIDTVAAKLIPINRLELLGITPSIRNVIKLANSKQHNNK
jgi:8-oxo-dGTP pyrophosphatase MutT (NUDIX family)